MWYLLLKIIYGLDFAEHTNGSMDQLNMDLIFTTENVYHHKHKLTTLLSLIQGIAFEVLLLFLILIHINTKKYFYIVKSYHQEPTWWSNGYSNPLNTAEFFIFFNIPGFRLKKDIQIQIQIQIRLMEIPVNTRIAPWITFAFMLCKASIRRVNNSGHVSGQSNDAILDIAYA